MYLDKEGGVGAAYLSFQKVLRRDFILKTSKKLNQESSNGKLVATHY